jgi:hypothetical protein
MKSKETGGELISAVLRIRIYLSCWIWIRKATHKKKEKRDEISCFELLDVFF